MDTVLVTGCNGFLGGHLIKKLICNYKVIGTVRSNDKGESLINELSSNCAPHLVQNFNYKVWQLGDELALTAILDQHPEISKIMHCSGPYDFSIKDFVNQVIHPTIKTMEIFISILPNYKNISHFLLTSSFSCHYNLEQYSDNTITLNENSWCNYDYVQAIESPFKAYHYAKTQSALMYWDFINKSDIIGLSISPFFMFGPQPFDTRCLTRLNSSNELFNLILNSGDDLSKIPNLFGYVSDVRDIAELHIMGLQNKNLNNKILLPYLGIFSCAEILNLTKDKWPNLKLPPKTTIDISLAKVDNSTTNKLINYKFIDTKKTLYDTLEQIIRVKQLST